MTRAPLALIVLLAGCATLRGGSDAKTQYQAGLDALARRDFSAAVAGLDAASRSGDRDLARRAMLMLATVHLDPDNPVRDPAAAGEAAARLLERAEPGSAEYLTAGMLERVAHATGDMVQDLEAATAERDRAWAHIDSLQIRVGAIEGQRDSVERRIQRLEMVGDSLEKELKKTTQELERIRRVIRD